MSAGKRFARLLSPINRKRKAAPKFTWNFGAAFEKLSAARAAIHEKECGDDEPHPIVIDEVAKAVVIHMRPSFQELRPFRRSCLSTIICLPCENVRLWANFISDDGFRAERCRKVRFPP